MDEDVRLMLEKEIDDLIKEKEKIEENCSFMLSYQGIEANLETILSYIIGFLHGRAITMYVLKYGRVLTADELKELMNLVKRRISEIRMTILETKIKKE